MKPPRPPPRKIKLAKSISCVCCEHGQLYVRLHGPDGKIFAAGIMDRLTAAEFVTQAIDALLGEDEPAVICEVDHA